jgi:PKHD-type hydroxylase
MTPFHLIPQALSAAECESLIALCKAAPMKDAGLVRQTTAHQIRRAELSWLDDLPEASWVMDRMMRLVAQANREAFGFDLTEFAESPQVARYGAEREGHFDWHSDIGTGTLAAKRKLTIVVQLSEPQDYENGTLELQPDSNIRHAPRYQGTAILFPSFVLHRVTPVTKGTRWSLTLWSHGPAFR